MIFASSVQVANTSYLWIYAIIGAVTLIGFGISVARYLRKQGARDAKIDELIDPDTGVMAQLAEITKNISPNGKNTQGVGDIVARIEEAVEELDAKFDRHLDSSDQTHRDMWRAITAKQDKGETTR